MSSRTSGARMIGWVVVIAMAWALWIPALPAQTAASHSAAAAALPDAPLPAFSGSILAAPLPAASEPPRTLLEDCARDTAHSPHCRVHWHQLIISTVVFNAFEDAGNLYTGYWYRYETTHGKWWDRYIDSAAGWRWTVWSDQNPFLDDYVGHPMMGAITNDLWIQNDPKSMTVEPSNTWPYWRRLLRAGAFSTAYSFAWKLGPTGEAAIGHNGDHPIPDGKGSHHQRDRLGRAGDHSGRRRAVDHGGGRARQARGGARRRRRTQSLCPAGHQLSGAGACHREYPALSPTVVSRRPRCEGENLLERSS